MKFEMCCNCHCNCRPCKPRPRFRVGDTVYYLGLGYVVTGFVGYGTGKVYISSPGCITKTVHWSKLV